MPSEVVASAANSDSANAADRDEDEDVMEVEAVVDMADEDDDEPMAEAQVEEVVEAEVVVSSAVEPSSPAIRRPPAPKPKKKKSKPKPKTPAPPAQLEPTSPLVPHHRLEAAREARLALQEQVPLLPIHIAETAVRSFGRLHVNGTNSNPFCSTSALYPIGFSCDRYEFSPVHGRVLKLRCSILSGPSIRQKQLAAGRTNTTVGDGPVFRILWGPGIDAESGGAVEYPFHPDEQAPPLIQTGSLRKDEALQEAVRYHQQNSGQNAALLPTKGMQVKVRFDGGKYHLGVVRSVGKATTATVQGTKKKRKQVEVTVKYEDEFQETLAYPDPDIVLLMPGVEDDVDSTGEVCLSELHGKPVHAVIGSSPIEAWGKLLVTLGMIDEIMYERAMELLEASRKEGMQEAKDKLENKGKKKDLPPDSVPSSVLASTPVDDGTPEEKKDSEDATMTEATNDEPVAEVVDDKEPPSEEELLLLKQVQDFETELEEAMNDNENAIIELCDARIAHLGPFLCNPFQSDEQSRVQQASWLATAVRKEKARMGSTGNKKKVISAVDLLERNDSIANSDIEALVEGLPGSEFCDSYVFHAFRTGGGLSRSWVHEAQLKNEKETVDRLEYQQAKEDVKKERFAKRKQKDDINATRKRQRVEEEEEKKKVRADERLARLQIQVDERLEKEAAGQREKVVQAFARSLAREFNRRRKMAEVVAAQMIVEGKGATASLSTPVPYVALPNASRVYNEDVLRVWSFVSTFGDFFLHRNYTKEIPSLDAMQDAIDCVAGQNNVSPLGLHKSVRFLTNLAETLTKPLASRVTRMLFASLVALAPALQKEFGATFFNDVNAVKTTIQTDKKKGSNKEDLLIPVNSMTWKEVARLTFLADALGELGQQKHEVSHLLRGYRSAGHPSSKEYRRLRKVEDFPMALIQQDIKEAEKTDDAETLNSTTFRIDTPCPPLRNSANPDRLASNEWPWLPQPADPASKNYRNGVGLLAELQISRSKLKECVLQREKYMEDALVLKEEMERQKLKEQGVDVEEEDDDDDDDDASKSAAGETVVGRSDSSNGPKEPSVSSEAVPTETVVVETDTPKEDPPSEAAHSETPKPIRPPVDSSSAAIGKETPYDDFCADKPSAPDLIRRCLAVLRAVAVSGPAEHFHYPVDPQTNPGYYDSILRPMCLREAGVQLYNCADLVRKLHTNSEELVEKAVAQFGRNIRLIGHNSLTYTNAGPTIVAAGTEMLRLFERLLLHWVLAPDHLLPKLTELDDEKCVEQHPTDEGSTVLLCDGCEGKYNVARLDPPLKEIPRGDWYCPRCVKGWWWGDVDPRIGKLVRKDQAAVNDEKHHLGCITSCLYSYPDVSAGEPSLRYQVEYGNGTIEVWPLGAVDNSLRRQNDPVPRIRCLEALVESRGYSFGIDRGLRSSLIPSVLNPNVSDAAARMALASSEFRETIAAVGSLPTLDLRDMTTKEWLRLLVLLITKCAATGLVENHAGKLESEAADRMAKAMDEVKKVQIGSLQDILPSVPDDPEDVSFSSRSRKPISLAQPVVVPSTDVSRSQNSSAPTKNALSQASDDQSSAVAVVVDVGSVEIVDEVDINAGGKVSQSAPTNQNAALLAIEKENPFTQSNGKKAKRQKVLEDSFAGYFIKNQMKPTVASFTQDSFSPSADCLLSPSDPQLSFANLRSRELLCSFCGLSDTDLGSPFVRVPDQQEWEVLMAHKSRSRRVHLVADIPKYPGSSESKLCSLRIQVDGELFSAVDSDLNWSKDGGMLEFPLRAKSGFQNDLLFRYETHLPFVTGSLSAHECCASAAHNARKERLLQRYKDERAEFYEREEGLTSGRTLQIGRDSERRSYWKFAAAAESLFICADGAYRFYEKPESIASVIVSLKKDSVVKALLESFPKAKSMIADGSWKNLLFARRFPDAIKAVARMEEPSTRSPLHSSHGAFRARDKVLVRSKNEAQLWEATVVEISTTQTKNAPVDAYLVGYNDWGSNFCEWVAPERVLAVNDPNCELQIKLLHDRSQSICGLPETLGFLHAKDFLFAKDRSRGGLPLPDFGRILHVKSDWPSWDEKTFSICKTAVLAMEAALPIGAVDTREKGKWRNDRAMQWRILVLESDGPVALMKCVFHLEAAISDDWFKESHGHVRTALPMAWKSIADASPSSCALRLVVLDRSILYKKVDKKRFSRKRRK